MRVVLDTNVLISAILFGGIPRQLLRDVIQGNIEAVTSARLLEELEGILEQKFGFSPAAATEAASEFEVLAVLVEPAKIPKICRDPDDDEVLAVAIQGRAEFVVTGDRDLLDLGEYQGIRILTPTAFARLFDNQRK